MAEKYPKSWKNLFLLKMRMLLQFEEEKV